MSGDSHAIITVEAVGISCPRCGRRYGHTHAVMDLSPDSRFCCLECGEVFTVPPWVFEDGRI